MPCGWQKRKAAVMLALGMYWSKPLGILQRRGNVLGTAQDQEQMQ